MLSSHSVQLPFDLNLNDSDLNPAQVNSYGEVFIR